MSKINWICRVDILKRETNKYGKKTLINTICKIPKIL